MYSSNRDELRRMYFTAWEKFKAHQELQPVEKQIVQAIVDHPEYHYIFDNPAKYADMDMLPEFEGVNPYLHLGMHLAIRDQIAMDKPEGLRSIFEQLAQKSGDVLDAEHAMMECLAIKMFPVLQGRGSFDMEGYMESLRKLV